MKKILGIPILGIGILSLMISACGDTPTSTAQVDDISTIVAGTMQALSPVVPTLEVLPTQVSGTPVSLENISFVIPPEIGSNAQTEKIEAVPPSADAPWWEIAPAYNKYLIQGYPLADTFHQPAIYIYPVDEYIQMNPDVATLMDGLKTIINSPGQPLPEDLPFLPTFNAAQVIHSNEQLLTFQNGSGIRYLTQFDQAPAPINNHELFYTFQGITADGKYYVSAILPINALFLAEFGSPEYAVPADGVPFDWDNYENIPAHFEAVKQKLDAADPNTFTPALASLDTIVQSILVTGNPQ